MARANTEIILSGGPVGERSPSFFEDGDDLSMFLSYDRMCCDEAESTV